MSLARFVLPLGYAASMVGFTAMRKAGLAQYLKPHSVPIALAAAFTMMSFVLAELHVIIVSLQPGDGRFDPMVLFVQNALLLVALVVRKEVPASDLASLVGAILVVCVLARVSAKECERYSSLTLGAVGVLLGGLALARHSSGARDRKLWLCAVWSVFSLATAVNCGPSLLAYAFAGLGSMWVLKFAHPVFGDKLGGEGEYSGVSSSAAAADLS